MEDEKDCGGGFGAGGINDKATIAKWRTMMKPKTSEGGTTSSVKKKKLKIKMKKSIRRGPKSKTGREPGNGGRRRGTDSSQQQKLGELFLLGSKGNSLGSSNYQ